MFVDFHTPVIQASCSKVPEKTPHFFSQSLQEQTALSQRRIFTPSTFFNVFPQTGHFPKNFCLAK